MRPYRFPLLVREIGILRRVLVGGAALVTLGLAFLFVFFRAGERYRLLAGGEMLRGLMLPAGLILGGLAGFLAFVREMREGTWDGWLLLPRSRATLALAKAGVGLAGLFAALFAPTTLLWLVLRLSDRVGGPVIGLDELLLRTSLTEGALVAMTAYLATATSALLAREGHVAFAAPLVVPLFATVRLYVGSGGFHALPEPHVKIGLVVGAALMLMVVVLAIARTGREVSATDTSLRALLLMPTTLVLAVVVSLVSFEVATRSEADRATPGGPPERRLAIGSDGTFGRHRDEVAMHGLRPLDQLDERRPSRLRNPVHQGWHLRLFGDDHRHVLSAYDPGNGRALGCIGPGGLAAGATCDAFDGAASVISAEHGMAVILTPTSLHQLDERGAVRRLRSGGAIRGAVYMSRGVAVAMDDDLLLVRATYPERKEGAGGPMLAVEVACRGIARAGQHLDGVALVDTPPRPFVAARLADDVDADRTELVVCRAGEVSDRVFVDRPAPTPPGARDLGRGDAGALAVGPVLDALLADRDRSSPRAWPLRRVAPWIVALGSTLLVGALFWARRRVVPWWVLPGLALGPAYVLAAVLITWRRPRWAGLVGASG